MSLATVYRLSVTILVVGVGVYSIVAISETTAGQESRPAVVTAQSEFTDWLSCDAKEEVDALLVTVHKQLTLSPVLVEKDDLRSCLDVVLHSFCEKSSKPFRDGLLVAPRTLHAEPFIDFLRTEVRPAVLPESTAELSAQDAFFYLLDHPEHRNMTPVRVERSSIKAGRGLVLEQREEWNSTSVFAQKSMVQTPQGGFLTSDQVERLDLGSQSFWLDMVVEFAEGYQSRVRLIFYYNTEHERWFPTAIIVDDPMMSTKGTPSIVLRPWPVI